MVNKMVKIEVKEVKKLNNTAGYIPMKLEDIGKEFIVMTQKDLDYVTGREYKE